ncbi:TIGR03086 family metal-binding protein [Kitasatospora azatica]|uniref:TIGR03086 family metal-binding protein n=1 Tax=Kitasatospora azatica TaxID=58347 RepID=UPI00068CD209|nr:TIGR03086 family metal-binding protein [Kitasatospora azatica]
MSISRSHAQALALVAPVVAAVRREHLGRPTPCAGWDLRRLLEHLIGQQYGFAAAARGDGERPGVFADRPLPDAPGVAFTALAGFADSAAELVESFEAAETTGRAFALPEIRRGVDFPATHAIGFHLLDTLVHGWDLAVTLDLPFDCPPELARPLLRVAQQVPADPATRAPGRSFAPVLPEAGTAGTAEATEIPDAAGPFEQALRLLGRDPAWRA